MNENIELLEHIYQTVEMGMDTIDYLLEVLVGKDNKIKHDAEKEKVGYQTFLNESKKLLKSFKTKPKKNNAITKKMAHMSINKEVSSDNSDAHIAEMLIQGHTMGITEMEKLLSRFEGHIEENIFAFAQSLLDFQKKCVEILKAYF